MGSGDGRGMAMETSGEGVKLSSPHGLAGDVTTFSVGIVAQSVVPNGAFFERNS